jgi:UDP-glucose 4-epimerase
LASHVGQELSYERPAHDFQVNALATSQLAQWAMENGRPRFIFASSMNVYGDPKSGARRVDESEPPNPPSPYAVAKLASEGLLEVLGAVGLDAASLRLFNVYGPGQDLNNMKQGMVSIFLSFVLRGEPIRVRGSLDRFRDFVFVDDVVNAFLTLGRLPNVTGQFNVGTGRMTTVHELLRRICTAMGVDPEEYEITEHEGTIRDQFGIYADITKLRGLGWTPNVELSHGLTQMADWARASRFASS